MALETTHVTKHRETRHNESEGASLRTALDEARRTIAHLEAALLANRRISISVGILMSRHGLAEEEAFQLLLDQSQSSYVKLRSVAETIIREGDVPAATQTGDAKGPRPTE